MLLTWLKEIKILKYTLKDNAYLFLFLIDLLNLCLLWKTDRFEKGSLTARSLTQSGRNNFTKIGSFPFLRGPDCHFWKLRSTSLRQKQLWISVICNFSLTIFDSKIKINFEERIWYKVPISLTPSVSRIWKNIWF